jgi:hypothetical protein
MLGPQLLLPVPGALPGKKERNMDKTTEEEISE